MAGSYPDAPSWRIAWDEDGTKLVRIDSSNVITDIVTGDYIKLNDEDPSTQATVGWNDSAASTAVLFPCLMDIDAVFITTNFNSRPSAIKTSVDTTNGVDGTWVTQSVGPAISGTGKVAMRNEIVSSTWGGIKAIKIYQGMGGVNSLNTIHLYGEPTAGQLLDRLLLWHPTLDQRVSAAYFDFGNTPRGSSADLTFRVKNISAGLTANAPRVSLETLTDASPSFVGEHTLSKGSGFASQQTLANISPGAISAETVTIRRTTPTNAQLGLWDLRIQAEATSWS